MEVIYRFSSFVRISFYNLWHRFRQAKRMRNALPLFVLYQHATFYISDTYFRICPKFVSL